MTAYVHIPGSNFVLWFSQSDPEAIAEQLRLSMTAGTKVSVFKSPNESMIVDFRQVGACVITAAEPDADVVLVPASLSSIMTG